MPHEVKILLQYMKEFCAGMRIVLVILSVTRVMCSGSFFRRGCISTWLFLVFSVSPPDTTVTGPSVRRQMVCLGALKSRAQELSSNAGTQIMSNDRMLLYREVLLDGYQI